ncbi:MAG: hypothetical protein KGH55_03445 [Nanoarchaeota archaeon]|nr:hypothetical protein [Nanoarchaeota archaeon]
MEEKPEHPLLVLIADAHGAINTFEKQKEIIERYKPVFVLSESMENNNVESDFDFNRIMKKDKISNMTSMKDVKELIKLCHGEKTKLIGIDFENFLIDRKLQIKLNRYPDRITDEEEKKLEELGKRRENKHVKMIQKYLEISRKPLVVIVNAKELRKYSLIRKSFSHYHLVYMANPQGEMILSPTKEKLKWIEEDF